MTEKTTDTETEADLLVWAEGIAKAVTSDELARLLRDYRDQARNQRRSASDRAFAKRRASVLARFVKT